MKGLLEVRVSYSRWCLLSNVADVFVIGIRVSLYNAITEDETDKLCSYVKEFIEKESTNKVE